MKTIRRFHPICPKCKSEDTCDILPDIPNTSHIEKDGITTGNSTFYCLNCEYSWKKFCKAVSKVSGSEFY